MFESALAAAAARVSRASRAAAKPRAGEPELAVRPEHAERAAELARRERRIRERLQAVLGERAGPQQRCGLNRSRWVMSWMIFVNVCDP